MSEDETLARVIDHLMTNAIENDASDVHIEPAQPGLRVRFRIDGVLYLQYPPVEFSTCSAEILRRLKTMAGLNPSESSVRQEGRFTISTAPAGGETEVRIGTIPMVEGEAIIMRLLRNTGRSRMILGGESPN